MDIKTRFAPSPTGNLHIGNMRTALFSWLFARRHGGKFLLRIEDSDVQRSADNFIDCIISDMKWLHLDWDEGPYFQTDRLSRYNSIIDYMLKNNIAYKCYCSLDRLQSLRASQMKRGEKPKYDGYCYFNRSKLALNVNKIFGNSERCNNYVVRFRNPQTGTVMFNDQIRGNIVFNNNELDDLIICRSDGSPTYNFCVVIDDMDMEITHVIRGEEHINNTPRQINILKALNASIPVYAHVSMVLDHDRKKLSKRCNFFSTIQQYRDDGFLPEAILNYLIRLGWSYKDQELFSIEEMKQYFDLKKISKSSSVFNLKKLLWYNHYYLNHLPINYLTSYFSQYMSEQNIDVDNKLQLSEVIKLYSKRSYTLKEVADNCLYLYKDFDIFDKKIAKNYLTSHSIVPLQTLQNKLYNMISWRKDYIKAAILDTVSMLSIDIKKIGMPLRIALTGNDISPELSSIVYVMGKVNVLKRIDRAIFYAQQNIIN